MSLDSCRNVGRTATCGNRRLAASTDEIVAFERLTVLNGPLAVLYAGESSEETAIRLPARLGCMRGIPRPSAKLSVPS